MSQHLKKRRQKTIPNLTDVSELVFALCTFAHVAYGANVLLLEAALVVHDTDALFLDDELDAGSDTGAGAHLARVVVVVGVLDQLEHEVRVFVVQILLKETDCANAPELRKCHSNCWGL